MASAKSEQFGSCVAELPEDDDIDTKSENVDQNNKENIENVIETSTGYEPKAAIASPETK